MSTAVATAPNGEEGGIYSALTVLLPRRMPWPLIRNAFAAYTFSNHPSDEQCACGRRPSCLGTAESVPNSSFASACCRQTADCRVTREASRHDRAAVLRVSKIAPGERAWSPLSTPPTRRRHRHLARNFFTLPYFRHCCASRAARIGGVGTITEEEKNGEGRRSDPLGGHTRPPETASREKWLTVGCRRANRPVLPRVVA